MMDDSLSRVQGQIRNVRESEKFILSSITKYLKNQSSAHELSKDIFNLTWELIISIEVIY